MLRFPSYVVLGSMLLNRCGYLQNFTHGPFNSWHHKLFGFINIKVTAGVLLKKVDNNMAALCLRHNTFDDNVMIRKWEHDGWNAIHDSYGDQSVVNDPFEDGLHNFCNSMSRNSILVASLSAFSFF